MKGITSAWTDLSYRRQMVLVGTMIATVLMVALQLASRDVDAINAIVLLLLLTLVMSETFGIRIGLLWALISDSILIFFFFEPYFRFWAYDIHLRITLAAFLLVAAIAGSALQERRSQSKAVGSTEKGEPRRLSSQAVRHQVAVTLGGDAVSLRIDVDRHVVFVNDREIPLTPTEFSLLQYLTSNAGRVLSHRSILANVWGEEYVADTQILRTYIKQLRAKLGDEPSAPRFIRTESRLGYRFITPDLASN